MYIFDCLYTSKNAHHHDLLRSLDWDAEWGTVMISDHQSVWSLFNKPTWSLNKGPYTSMRLIYHSLLHTILGRYPCMPLLVVDCFSNVLDKSPTATLWRSFPYTSLESVSESVSVRVRLFHLPYRCCCNTPAYWGCWLYTIRVLSRFGY